MKVLIACEFSGIVREAFRKEGHDAWSCDLLPTEIEGNHIQGDVLEVLDNGWDMMIAHPPCTYLANVGNAWLKQHGRIEKRKEAIEFFMMLTNAPIPKIAIENPVGCMSTIYRKPDQYIQPYYFGDNAMKKTCIWLKNLPLLQPTKILSKPKPIYTFKRPNGKIRKTYFVDSMPPSLDRAKKRSRTFKGIADAMAKQWGIK